MTEWLRNPPPADIDERRLNVLRRAQLCRDSPCSPGRAYTWQGATTLALVLRAVVQRAPRPRKHGWLQSGQVAVDGFGKDCSSKACRRHWPSRWAAPDHARNHLGRFPPVTAAALSGREGERLWALRVSLHLWRTQGTGTIQGHDSRSYRRLPPILDDLLSRSAWRPANVLRQTSGVPTSRPGLADDRTANGRGSTGPSALPMGTLFGLPSTGPYGVREARRPLTSPSRWWRR